MNKIFSILSFLFVLAACNNGKNIPDVSGINVDLKIERFDKDFFAIDSDNIWPGLNELAKIYPTFTPVFVSQIMGLGPMSDSNKLIVPETRHFIHFNQALKDSVWQKFTDLSGVKNELTKAFQLVKYYFANYRVPNIITFIGNFGGREIYTPDGLGIGLDFYMGNKFSYYQIPEVQEIYPSYLSRRFSPEYLPVNSMRAVIDDLYPDSSFSRPLIEQMIEQGKRMELLDRFLPATADTLKYGYTKKQLDWCEDNERDIWAFFINQDLLYSIDPSVVSTFINDGPNTQGMPADSPGKIGLFLGWQIVKKYLKNHPGTDIKVLMKTPAKQILDESKYRP